MKIHPRATKGHLIVGLVLILLSLGSLLASFVLCTKILSILIFFFGVWGGVEIGRYLEFWLGQKNG